MGGIRKLLTIFAAAALLALGVAACGGGSDNSGSTAEKPQDAGATANGTGGMSGEKGSKPAGGGSQKSNGTSQKTNKTNSAAKPHNDSGGGAAQFRSPGGDNSIQEYGDEAGSSEMKKASAALHAFLDARASGKWGKACGYMSSTVTKQFQQLAASAAKNAPAGAKVPKNLGCPQILHAMSASLPASVKHELTKADVGALRVEGERAFLLFHGAHGRKYFMPMAKEGGKWKVAALAASEVP